MVLPERPDPRSLAILAARLNTLADRVAALKSSKMRAAWDMALALSDALDLLDDYDAISGEVAQLIEWAL